MFECVEAEEVSGAYSRTHSVALIADHCARECLDFLWQAIAYLQAGIRRKVMAAHSMNASSSR